MVKTDKTVDELVQKKLNDLLSIVDERSLLVVNKNGTITIGGMPATPEILANLHSEAEFFSESELWKIIHNKVNHEAQRIMFVTGTSLKEIEMGRSMLYLLDMQKRFINIFKSYNPNKFA